MAGRQKIAVVAQNPVLLTTLVSWIEAAGYPVAAASSFKDGRVALEDGPALLITELKLGEYNGLHLSLRARSIGVPAAVIGPDDPVLARDADELGAVYIASRVHRRRILELIAERLEQPQAVAPGASQPWADDFGHVLSRRRQLALN
jgi:DNA-binding NtrC family response regulator